LFFGWIGRSAGDANEGGSAAKVHIEQGTARSTDFACQAAVFV